jgi:hypothetical protein
MAGWHIRLWPVTKTALPLPVLVCYNAFIHREAKTFAEILNVCVHYICASEIKSSEI